MMHQATFCIVLPLSYAASSGLNFCAHHGGSSFRMLFQMSCANTAAAQVRVVRMEAFWQ